MDSLFNELKELIIINGQLEVNTKDIIENTNLVEDLAYNSISLILLMIAIEEKWGVDMDEDGIDSTSLTNIDYILEVITNRIS